MSSNAEESVTDSLKIVCSADMTPFEFVLHFVR